MLERVLRATLIAAFVVAPLPASSAFVSDYSDWQKLSEVARQGFVTGAMDRLTTMISDDAEKAMAKGVKTCLGTVQPGTRSTRERRSPAAGFPISRSAPESIGFQSQRKTV
jgi:hypothetical protein